MMKLIKNLFASVMIIFLVSMAAVTMIPMINVASAPPDTHFWMNPSEIIGEMPPDGKFKLYINIAEAPLTYAWEIHLSWDPDLLELALIQQEEFLRRGGTYLTDLAYVPLNESNAAGEISISCTLTGDPESVLWASGDGVLCWLGFLVEAEGSCLLNLFDTRLADHMEEGYPSYTYYQNDDSFFCNVSPSHDIKITDVTVITPKVQVGEVASMNVTVLNEGTEDESISLNVYAGVTLIGTTVVYLNGTGNFENRSFTYDVTWNTTGVAGEPYTISAYVPPVPDEVDTADNTFTDDTVTVWWDHDIKISDITILTPEVPPGGFASITATVFNQGNFSETFNITMYADLDAAVVGDEITVGTQADSLGAGNSYPYDFFWDTTGFAGGIYTVSAYVPPVPGEVDPNIADNTFIDGAVTIQAHDIAITNVTRSPTTVNIGEIVSINVTVTNKHFFQETFNVTTYYDSTPIKKQTNINLDAGATTTLTFKWNTTFVTAGVYSISAKASVVPNEINTADNTYIDGDVTVQRLTGWPIANFTYSPEKPLLVNGEAEVTFESTSYDEDGYIVSWNWDFNDDGITDATTENATWVYTEAGSYVVRLIVNDNDTFTPPQGIEKMISVQAPPVAIFMYSPEDPMSNDTVTFNATDSYDPDGVIVSYFWDFGDGTNATGVTADHAYTDDGNYTVTLTVTDDDELKGTTSDSITVRNRPPEALFTESAETVDTGVVISFNASGSYDPDGYIASYFWDFGDGTNATGITVTHAYVDDGVYTVTLTVTDDDEATDTATATKTVLNRPPVASFTESAETVDTGETITFNATDSYDPDGVIVSYFWDFGDGTNATGVTADHAYTDDGNYTVTLTVTDEDGATNSVSATKTVEAPEGLSLALYAAIGMGIAALTLIALYALFRRRKG